MAMMGPPHTQPQGHYLPSHPSPESAAGLQRAIASMEEKGLQDDPRYAQLLALRARTMHGQHDQGFQYRQVM